MCAAAVAAMLPAENILNVLNFCGVVAFHR